MMKRVNLLRLGQLTTLLLAIHARYSYMFITKTPDDSPSSPLDDPLFTISNISSIFSPQSWITLQGRIKMTDLPQTASTTQLQTNSNVQSSALTTTTTVATTAETRPTLSTTPPVTKTLSIPPTPRLPVETVDVSENDGITSDDGGTAANKVSLPNYTPFTADVHFEDVGRGGLGKGNAEFWWQVATAHYVYCGHACNSSGLKRPSYLKAHDCQSCRCDNTCLFYGDCCPDTYARQGYIDVKASSLGVRCTDTSFGSPVDETSERYVMVTRCPGDEEKSGVGGDGDDEALRESCETNSTSHWNLTQPVTDMDSFITYKNRYCAQCFFGPGAPAAINLKPWEPRVVIRDPAYVTGVISSANLYSVVLSDPVNAVAYNRPKSSWKHVRKCHPAGTVVDRCNVTGKWKRYDVRVEAACLLVAAPIFFGAQLYRNSFCVLCNVRIPWDELLRIRFVPTAHFRFSVPLLILLDFSDSDDSNTEPDGQATGFVLENSAEPQCSSDQFLDTRTSSCRQVICNLGKATQKHNDTIACRSSPRSSNLYGYKVCLQDNNSSNNNTIKWDQLPAAVSSLDPRHFVRRSLPGLDQDLLYGRGDVHRVRIVHRQGRRTEEGEGHDAVTFTNLYVFAMFYMKPADRDVVDQSMLTNLDYLLRRFDKALSTITTATDNNNNNGDDYNMRLRLAPTCDPSTFGTLITSTAAGGDATAESDRFAVPRPLFSADDLYKAAAAAVYLPLANSLMCPFVELAWSDFSYDPATSEIIVGSGRKSSFVASTHHRIGLPNFFIVDSNRTLVCIDEYRKINWTKRAEVRSSPIDKAKSKIKGGSNAYDPLKWVALISTAVSLVFLFISFVIYCLFSSLRTVAGINNLVLITALFSAQVFLQIAADVPLVDWLCQVVGVATHFFWLAVVFAQNACTFHMFYTLSFPFLSRAATCNPSLMTVKYSTYVITASVVFVGATLSWQLGAEGRSGYGGAACYIVDSEVRILMFAVPLAVTVVVNVSMFLFTIVRLRSVQHVGSTRSHRTGLILYTKLSVFTGLTWLLGFLASLLGSEVLAYFFAVFQGCHGLFVFLAFLANRRLVALVNALLTGKGGARRSGQGHSAKVTGSTGNASQAVKTPAGSSQ